MKTEFFRGKLKFRAREPMWKALRAYSECFPQFDLLNVNNALICLQLEVSTRLEDRLICITVLYDLVWDAVGVCLHMI